MRQLRRLVFASEREHVITSIGDGSGISQFQVTLCQAALFKEPIQYRQTANVATFAELARRVKHDHSVPHPHVDSCHRHQVELALRIFDLAVNTKVYENVQSKGPVALRKHHDYDKVGSVAIPRKRVSNSRDAVKLVFRHHCRYSASATNSQSFGGWARLRRKFGRSAKVKLARAP
jgi:hypothetical protein